MQIPVIEVGARFGRLVIVEPPRRLQFQVRAHLVATCRCDCGTTTTTRVSRLVGGNCRSCGCYRRDVATVHGMTARADKRPVYFVWNSMIGRCLRPSDTNYPRYGARGITVDPDWLVFEHFLRDMGEPPPGMTLDRRDTRGPYSKANCRWATRRTQANNKTNNRLIEHDGRRQTLAQWARETGVGRSTINARLVLGWPVERALSTPVRPMRTQACSH